jgi:hypothetical protein
MQRHLLSAILLAAAVAVAGRADVIPDATFYQAWTVGLGNSFLPLSTPGPNTWADNTSGVSITHTGYTEANASTTPYVEADVSGIEADGLGSSAYSYIDYFFEVQYTGGGMPVSLAPVSAQADLRGDGPVCDNSVQVYVYTHDSCDGAWSIVVDVPVGTAVGASVLALNIGAYDPGYFTASVTLALSLDQDPSDWAQLTGDTNPANYTIKFSPNLTASIPVETPEDSSTALFISGVAALFAVRCKRGCGITRGVPSAGQ